MWSSGNLKQRFMVGLFNTPCCPSGFRTCGPKLSDAAPIFPNMVWYQLRYIRALTKLYPRTDKNDHTVDAVQNCKVIWDKVC